MASSVTKKPQTLSFTGNMSDLVVDVDGTSALITLTATHGGTAETLLSERFWPDSDGNVTISQLGPLLEPYCRKYASVTLSAVVRTYSSDDDETGTDLSVDMGTVLFGEVDAQVDASTFCSNHFLTTLNGEKLTAIGRTESLSAYVSTTVSVSALLMLADGTFKTVGATLNAANTTNSVSDFNVSPQNIFDLVGGTTGQSLVSYTISAGSRKQNYRVIEDQVPPAPVLVFLNSFGCWEYIYCTGTHKKEGKYTYSTAKLDGLTRNYKIKREKQFTANTGYMNRAMADWADDMFVSQNVYLYSGKGRGKEVVLSSPKDEITNEDDNMPAFEFQWTYAQEQHTIMDTERYRVFDNTFDYTFE